MIWYLISITDLILFVMVGFTVLYLSVFAIASVFYSNFQAPTSRRKARFLILMPARECGDNYEATLKALEAQDYDRRNFDILVVSSGNRPLTNMKLAQHNLSLQIMPEGAYSDLLAWKFGITHSSALRIYDMVVILEAGETVGPDYLTDINEAFQLGSKAIQTHRIIPERKTKSAIISASFEEINASIFRMGHVAMGLSSGLAGSGMAFEYKWFRENIVRLPDNGDLKALEALVLRERKYVDYLDKTIYYAKPEVSVTSITQKRQGWMYAQWYALRTNIGSLLPALLHRNYDLFDKIIQWMLMPRLAMMSVITIMALVTPFFWWSMTLKWIAIGLWVAFIYAVATPDYLVDKNWERASYHTPLVMLRTFFYALPTGWLYVFARNRKDEWREDIKELIE